MVSVHMDFYFHPHLVIFKNTLKMMLRIIEGNQYESLLLDWKEQTPLKQKGVLNGYVWATVCDSLNFFSDNYNPLWL